MGVREIEEVLDNHSIRRNGGYLTAQEISRLTRIHIANITRDLKKMERRGMIKSFIQTVPMRYYQLDQKFYEDEDE